MYIYIIAKGFQVWLVAVTVAVTALDSLRGQQQDTGGALEGHHFPEAVEAATHCDARREVMQKDIERSPDITSGWNEIFYDLLIFWQMLFETSWDIWPEALECFGQSGIR